MKWVTLISWYIYINREEGAIYLLTESATCFNTSWSCCCDSFSTCVFCFPFLCFSLSSFSIVAQFSPKRPLITLMMSSVPINPSSSKSALKKMCVYDIICTHWEGSMVFAIFRRYQSPWAKEVFIRLYTLQETI